MRKSTSKKGKIERVVFKTNRRGILLNAEEMMVAPRLALSVYPLFEVTRARSILLALDFCSFVKLESNFP